MSCISESKTVSSAVSTTCKSAFLGSRRNVRREEVAPQNRNVNKSVSFGRLGGFGHVVPFSWSQWAYFVLAPFLSFWASSNFFPLRGLKNSLYSPGAQVSCTRLPVKMRRLTCMCVVSASPLTVQYYDWLRRLLLVYKIYNLIKNKRSKDLGALLDSCSWDDKGNFLQMCIKNSLLQTKSIEIWVNSHTVPHYACINFRSYSTP